MNQNSVNDRNVTMQEQDFQKHLLRFERALSTLEGYEGWMIGQTALEVRFFAPLHPDEEVYLLDSGQEERNAVHLRTKQEGKEILSIEEK